MRDISQLQTEIRDDVYREILQNLYVDTALLDKQKERYCHAIDCYKEHFSDKEVAIFSAPGRSEIGGNHTDHQHGNVLCAAIHLDAIAVTGKRDDNVISIKSEGYPMIQVSLDDLVPSEATGASTASLVQGVVAGFKAHNYRIGGFNAYIASDVLIGAGLSSSASFEVLIGTILSGLYNDMCVPAMEIAKIGQYAENVFFKKPCGLMDQAACALGSMVHIDFYNPNEPKIEQVDFQPATVGYCLCVTNTKGSHASLTKEYASIPKDMKDAAGVFHKEFLAEVPLDLVYSNLSEIREKAGDMAALRAIHFVEETKRAVAETEALKKGDFKEFLALVKASGDSSYKYLQNVFTPRDAEHQSLSIGLAFSDHLLHNEGASRVHGGGFAGTIQAFVPKELVTSYKDSMDELFGDDACTVLQIRKYGGIQVM
ncbi:MAG: galactokinase [Lachnospiraceae bacterium]|nr:galactokinase [Lachnospiraceae bacterium]